MPIKRDQLISILTNKGFQKVEDDKNRDHDWFYFTDPYTGQVYVQIRTKISRGKKYKTIDDNLLRKIRKQLKFENTKQFKAYLACKYTHKDHYESLKQRGII